MRTRTSPVVPLVPRTLPPIALAGQYPLHVVRAHVRAGLWTRVRPGAYIETELLIAPQRSAVDRATPGPAPKRRARTTTNDARAATNDGAGGGAQPDPTRLALARIAAVIAQGRERNDEPLFVHGTAALLHGLPLWAAPPKTHLARPAVPGRGASADLVVHRIPVNPGEIAVLDGIRVTDIVRTTVDIARQGDIRAGIVVLDGALRSGVPRDLLAAEVARHPGQRGVRTARELVEIADGGSESPWESWTRVHALAAGLPRPVTQHLLDTWAGRFYADLAWPEHRVVVEFDGLVKYTRLAAGDPSAVVIAEKAREDAIRSEGWTVVRVTASDLRDARRFAARLVAAFPPGVRCALQPRPHLTLR